MPARKPRIILWDLETSLNIIAAFELFNKMPLPHGNILQDWTILCGSWKELGKRGVHTVCVDAKDVKNDKKVVETLHKVLSGADAIVAHYGDAFDMKKFNTRSIKYGLGPIPNIIQIDTVKIARAKFKFTSNRLDYLGEYLEVGRKIHTDMDLWLKCLAGTLEEKSKALKEMVRYNRQDVVLLEKVYMKLRAYVPAHVNHRLYGDRDVCEQCGSDHINYRGYQRTKQRVYKSFQCQDCGAWGRSRKSEKL